MGTFVLTPEEMRKIDKWTIEEFGIPGFTLMEAAGRGIFDIITEHCEGMNVIVLAGAGNNGGDGFVVARYLLNYGYNVVVVFTGREEKLKGEALKNYELFKKLNGSIVPLEEFELDYLYEADIIVDAIFGTGFKGEVKEPIRSLIEKVNEIEDVCIVSVDIPSGINGLNGEIGGVAINADITGTMAFPKRGLLLYPGRAYAGDIIVIDIGVPSYLPFEPEFRILEPDNFYLPFKLGNEHKGKNGRLLIISGNVGFTGAPELASQSALITGAGLVYLLVPEKVYPILASKLTSPVVKPYNTVEDIRKEFESFNPHGIVFGPGLGRNENTVEILKMLVEKAKNLPVVIDADGIWAMKNLESFGREEFPNWVITPHPGEARFLIDAKPDEIDKDRFEFAKRLKEKMKCNVVLKGAPTTISLIKRGNFVNIYGNEGLGKGGSGDVLAGLIGGYAVQTHDIENAALLGVYLHAIAGDILYERLKGPYYLPEDLIHVLPEAIEKLRTF